MQHLHRKSVVRPDAVTLDWKARVIAAGGTALQSTVDAVDTFVRETKASGVWPLLLDVGVFAGDQLAAALVKLKYPAGGQSTLTNMNFVGGDYTERGVNGGLLGNGATKYLKTGVTPPAQTGTLGFYVRTPVAAGYLMGSLDDFGAASFYWANAASEFNWGASLADGTFAGAIVGTSHDVHAEYIYQNGARIALRDPGALNVASTGEIYIFALNDAESGVGPVPEQWFQGRGSFYSIGYALTEPQSASLSTSITNLQTALNRL
jgi:hypothetical protein